MGLARQRWATSLVIRIARSRFVLKRPAIGEALLDTLDLDATRSLGRLEAVVASLDTGAYRRQWLGAARRLLALAGRARRGELAARRIARALAEAPFLFDADEGERATIIQLIGAVGSARVAPHLRDGRQARAIGTFLAMAEGNEAARLFAELAELWPFSPEDRHRMVRKLLVRYEHAIVDRSDVLRFAVRLGRRYTDAALADQLAAALAASPEDRSMLAMTLVGSDAAGTGPAIAFATS